MVHTYGAEYGKRAGGQVSIVTSSGTNQWHGGLFEYHRNSALDAKDFFADEKNPFKRHQYGGTIGGPLMKDKLFVFGNRSEEHTSELQSRLHLVCRLLLEKK